MSSQSIWDTSSWYPDLWNERIKKVMLFFLGGVDSTPHLYPPAYTAKTQYRKFKTNYPRKELRGHNSDIHISVSDFYIFPDRSAYSVAGK
jgi:hypothetical protein